MPFNINELPLRRCVYSGNEVETVKVRYGDISGTKYAGLNVDVSYIVRKRSLLTPPLFTEKFYATDSDIMTVIFSSVNNNALHKIKKLSLSGHVYSKSGDDTVFYDKYFSYTDITSDTFELNVYGTNQSRIVLDLEGYIMVATYIDLDYIITYDDNSTYSGKYNNYIYDEYGVNDSSGTNNANSTHAFGGTFNIYAEKEYLEKVVWTKDPLRVYRQQIESIIIYDVGVVSEYIGTYCGDDEYKYYCDNNPGIVVRIKDVAYTKASKIKSITLTGYAHILVNNTYLYKAKTETDTLTGNEVGSVISVYPYFDYLADYEYSTALPRVEYSIKLEVTYEDGYVYTYNKSNLIYMSIEDTNNSFKRYNIETTAFPALKN